MSKKKETIYLGDLESFGAAFYDSNKRHPVRALLGHRNFHLFHLRSSLESSSSIPFSIDALQGGKSFMGRVHSKGGRLPEDPKIKMLGLQERYLDQFVRGLS